MTRVPAALALLALSQSGVQIKASSLRNWTYRRYITRTREGYDLREILAYLDTRRADQHGVA